MYCVRPDSFSTLLLAKDKAGFVTIHSFSQVHEFKGLIMDITSHAYNEQITLIEVTGAIDGSSAPQLRTAITEACATGQHLLLDMSQVHFMSSAGLRVMLLLHRQLQQSDARVVLVGMLEPIYDAMEATGFLKYFETAPDRDTGARLLGA